MKPVRVGTTVEPRRIADLLCCGFEGGVGYWCQITGYTEPPQPPVSAWGDDTIFKHVDYPLCGGAVVCRQTDEEDGDDLILDEAAVKRGLRLLAEKAPRHWSDFVNETEDAITGDVFIQLALLGEVVYG